jgi:hypothetical protein
MRLPTARPSILWPVGCGTFVVFFVGLGVRNLRDWRATPTIALVASALWLLLVATMLAGACREAGGPHRLLLDAIGAIAGRHFVAIEREDGGQPLVCFGWRRLGWRVYHIKIRSDGIESVSWNAGQASAMSGDDVDDWSVAVWFATASVATSARPVDRRSALSLHLVGPSGSHRRIAELGHVLVAFLRSAGLPLVEAEGGAKFVRREDETPEP